MARRSKSRSTALTAALIGPLALAPAAFARGTFFEAQTGSANPLAGRDLGDRSAPALADLDGDGDLDLVAGSALPGLAYFANTGSRTVPAFVPRTGSANPFAGLGALAALQRAHPALGDLDGDRDLDVVVGFAGTSFVHLENTGHALAPAFVARSGALDPLAGQTVSGGPTPYSTPVLADLDADGDLDLLAGESAGTLAYFENTGDAVAPAFDRRSGAAHPLDGLDVGSGATPALGDLDGDGDLDLVVASATGALFVFENTGARTAPAFFPRTGLASPFEATPLANEARPALADLDGDGDLDLIAGRSDGAFDFLRNRARSLVPRTGTANPLGALAPVSDGTPVFGDLDGDGDPDLVVGESAGTLRVFVNTGSVASPAFVERTGAANPFAGRDVGTAAAPATGDLDRDGDPDFVVGRGDGGFDYYANTGTPATPAFVSRTGAANPFAAHAAGTRSTPTLGDFDRDGDLDLAAGGEDGRVRLLENTGTASLPAFVARSGSDNPFDAVDVGPRSAPVLGDFDGDLDLDLIVGNGAGTFAWFELRVLASAFPPGTPGFFARTGSANPLAAEDVGSNAAPTGVDLDADGDVDVVTGGSGSTLGLFENALATGSIDLLERQVPVDPLDGLGVGGSHASPALVDLDRDGDVDLLAGGYSGSFSFFENSGSAARAAFVERFGAAHPLSGQDVGALAVPAFGDLDADGDPDLLAGNFAGRLLAFENVGSATEPAFVATQGSAHPLAGVDLGYLAAPAFGDLDADGDLDLVAGELAGTLFYFANTGSPIAPVFVLRTGAVNPFATIVVGGWSVPILLDADRDGDLDLLVGDQLGQVATFLNTGSAVAPAFAAQAGALDPFDAQSVGRRAAPAAGDLDGDDQAEIVLGGEAGSFRTFLLPEPRGLLMAGLAFLAGLARRGRVARSGR